MITQHTYEASPRKDKRGVGYVTWFRSHLKFAPLRRRFGSKLLVLIIAVALTAFTASGSELVPYIAMPVGTGYAIDAKGVRHPTPFCMRDAVFAPRPQVGISPNREVWSADSAQWKLIEGSGLYRLDIDLNTGRVVKVTTVKSGSKWLDAASMNTFKVWVFRPGKWKQIIIPTTLRKKWVGMRVETSPLELP
jgi:hypothetical protein